MSVLIVTGTGTGVGKTVVVAAVAALAVAAGCRVAVLKPAQTGVGPAEPGDVDEVRRLLGAAGVTTVELARFGDPLAPATAARRAGVLPVRLPEVLHAVREQAAEHDLVLVEGAGGLLVRLAEDPPVTLADVAAALSAPVLVVVAAGLGTLNHAELTVEALRARRLECHGLALGDWPAQPDLAARCNLVDLPEVTGVPLLGRLPAGASSLTPEAFLGVARHNLAPALGGQWQTPAS